LKTATRPRFALIHSPLTSALVWRGVTDTLIELVDAIGAIRAPPT